jgi:hypothetical protein
MLVVGFSLLVAVESLLSSREDDTRSWANFLLYIYMKGHPPKRVCGVSLSLYTHAGVGHHPTGFVIGLAGSTVYHCCLIDLTRVCPAVVVSVDYHLAPKHSVPARYVDSLTSLKWVLSSAADPWLAAHGDPAHVFFAADNAGSKIHAGGGGRTGPTLEDDRGGARPDSGVPPQPCARP